MKAEEEGMLNNLENESVSGPGEIVQSREYKHKMRATQEVTGESCPQ
jgi:hypothetical protein